MAFDRIRNLGELRKSLKGERVVFFVKNIREVAKGNFIKRGSRLGKVTLNNGVFIEVQWVGPDRKMIDQRSVIRGSIFRVAYSDSNAAARR